MFSFHAPTLSFGEPGSLGLGEFGGRIFEAESQRLGPEQSKNAYKNIKNA